MMRAPRSAASRIAAMVRSRLSLASGEHRCWISPIVKLSAIVRYYHPLGSTERGVDMNALDADSKEARTGEKMVILEVRFWTNKLSKRPNHIRPKHIRAKGTVTFRKNVTHGLNSTLGFNFNSIMELPAAIEKLFLRHGIRVHPSQK